MNLERRFLVFPIDEHTRSFFTIISVTSNTTLRQGSRLDPDFTAKSVKKIIQGWKNQLEIRNYIISRVKMSVVSDFATKNLIFLVVFKKIYDLCPILVKTDTFRWQNISPIIAIYRVYTQNMIKSIF